MHRGLGLPEGRPGPRIVTLHEEVNVFRQGPSKRQKELARLEKRKEKEAKREQRRREKDSRPPPAPGEDPDLAGIVPGPQPPLED